ncbi:sigma-70 family RNA polymerase sigma factor [Myxococcus llanfairpwllgwyngyllgogerychwyrndrobwllllantysiliogogogochensis]|uniref:Sigma-70 family RNA polymerase sigma factor n=2 Tax=Myxococcaceae TaxID=31 RepID=A0A540WSM8_9BACT|nr:sigma-70 family RNA polymerase sigma factor [Myxococcus llanfairpwllgwyngyllgogerychwyrndrobwllllantysiliogogogochensis]
MNALALDDAPGTLAHAIGMLMADDAVPLPWKADVQAARRGDPSAFESLVRSVQRQVYGLALRLLQSEAEAAEVSQEALLRAYQNLHRYDDARPFDLWVLAITRNLCLDLLRRRTKVRTEELEPMKEVLPSGEASQEEGAIAREERQSLEDAMATLSVDDREVLALYYVQKRTTKEIAQILGCAPGTIMARLFRAREKLRKKMTTEEATR